MGRKRSMSPSRGNLAAQLTRTFAVIDIASIILGGSITAIMWMRSTPSSATSCRSTWPGCSPDWRRAPGRTARRFAPSISRQIRRADPC